MSYNPVENLEVWRRSKNLAVEIYRATASSRDFGLRDQLTRSAVSVPSNIAEGYERGTNPDKRHFYRVAKGSAGELRTQLVIAGEVGMIPVEMTERMVGESREIAAMIQGLIRSLPEA